MLAEWQNQAMKCAVCVGTSWVGGEAVQRCPFPAQAGQALTTGFCTDTFASGMCLWAEMVQACSMVWMGPVDQHAAGICVSAGSKGANRDQTLSALTGQTNTECGW